MQYDAWAKALFGKVVTRHMTNTIDLYTVLHLIDVFDSNDTIVYLKKQGELPLHKPSEIITVKEVKDKYDLRATKVSLIEEYWCYYEYEGFLLNITDGKA